MSSNSHRRIPPRRYSTTGWNELEREIVLEDGKSLIATIDPSTSVDQEVRDGRTSYVVHLSVEGEPALMKGGKRIKNAFLEAGIRTWKQPTKIQITAKGAPRSFDRDYHVEAIK